MELFENYERRLPKINALLEKYGLTSIEECHKLCLEKGFDPIQITRDIQPICFEDACWAYTIGAAVALKSGADTAADARPHARPGAGAACHRHGGQDRARGHGPAERRDKDPQLLL